MRSARPSRIIHHNLHIDTYGWCAIEPVSSSSLPPNERAIGIFDSGVGGLSVVREIRQILPTEHILYLADRAHCPYGARPREEVARLAAAITRFLLAHDAKLIVVACNSASVAALAELRAMFPIPFVGIVPAVKPAAQLTRTGKVGVMATPTTFQGELFAQLVRNHASGVEVLPMVCPGLVELAETGHVDGQEARALLERYVRPLVADGADVVVLGCTHYPFYRPLVEQLAGPDVAVIDTGAAVARQVARVLDAQHLRRSGGTGTVHYFTTESDIGQFRDVVQRLLGERPGHVEHAPIVLDADAEVHHGNGTHLL